MSHVVLKGCTSEPLASYLKSLAVVRLVAEQKDPDVRAWWDNDIFHLESALDEDGIVQFFSTEYAPSPLVAPWGARSGFYNGSSEKSARAALDLIAATNTNRLASFRAAITEVRALLQRYGFSTKPKDERAKLELMRACRSELPDSVLPWLDAVYALSDDWRAFAPLLGTGANEGSQSYSSTYAQMLIVLGFHQPSLASAATSLLRQALFLDAADGFVVAPAGQHDPGRAGGFNQGPGIEHKDFPINPWAVILAFEGSLLWSCGFSRSLAARSLGKGGNGRGAFTSPFTVRARAVGYSSSSETDDVTARAEIWTPLWLRAVPYPELRAFVGEGRAELGKTPATNGIEFAEAATSLGIDRGVAKFIRYTLQKRRGDSYVALPVGHFPVAQRSESDLVRQLHPILDRFDRFLRRFKEPPTRLVIARRGIDTAIYELLLHGGAQRVKALVAAAGRLERLLANRDQHKPPNLNAPLIGLHPTWLPTADDGTVEVRIAAALASIGATGEVGPLRANLAAIDPMKPWAWSNGRGQTAWSGNSLCARMAAVLVRRMMDAESLDCPSNPLRGALALSPEDIAAFIAGDADESLIEDLLFGFMWIRWGNRAGVREAQVALMKTWTAPVRRCVVPRSWALLKLLFLPMPLEAPGHKTVEVRPESAIVPRLCAGRIDDACQLARRRLFSAGLSPVRGHFTNHEDGVRLAAALLLPVQRVRAVARMVLHDGT